MAGDGIKEDMPSSPDIHFEPIVKLASIEKKTLEEDEDIVFKGRARLYRYENELDPPEWKERGTGEVKLLEHKHDKSRIRVLMRRDKTLKICANHYVSTDMNLKPNCGSNKAWVWYTPADFADEEAKAETLAIRFGNADYAKDFKEEFEKCQKKLQLLSDEKKDEEKSEDTNNTTDADGTEPKENMATENDKKADEVADKLGGLTVNDDKTDKPKEDASEKSKEDASDNAKEDASEKSKEDVLDNAKEDAKEKSKEDVSDKSKEDEEGKTNEK